MQNYQLVRWPFLTRARHDEAMNLAADRFRILEKHVDTEAARQGYELSGALAREAYWRERCELALDQLIARGAAAPLMVEHAPAVNGTRSPFAGMLTTEIDSRKNAAG